MTTNNILRKLTLNGKKKKFSIFILCDLLNDENGCEVSDENDF